VKRVLLTLIVAAIATAALADAPDWVTSAAAIPTPEYARSARAVVLLDSTAVLVGGSMTTRHRRVVRILGSHVRDVVMPNVVYDSGTALLSFHGWSIAPDRHTVTAVSERDTIESSPWGELYNDAHVKVLSFPSSDPGTIVAWESEQRDRPDFVQTTWSFQGALPVVNASLLITLPRELRYEAHWFRHADVQPVSDPPSTSWELHDIPAIGEEPHMPAFDALAGRLGLHFVAVKDAAAADTQSWAALARWYDGLAESRCAATPALQAKSRELAPADRAPLDRIRALAAFAQRDVRYVAIEIGVGGYQPHEAGEVFAKRYGDCKDKATLLRTMLRESGIESFYVILNATRGIVDPVFPSIGAFNHVILAIRMPAAAPDLYATIDHSKLGRLLLFDPTSTATPFGVLPQEEEGGHALLVTGDGGELITLPTTPAVANQLRRTAKLQLDADGTLRGDIEETRTGHLAAELRYALRAKNEAQRIAWIDSQVAAHLARPEVSGLSFEHVDDCNGDVVIRYKVVAHDYASHAAELTLVRPRVLGQKADTQIDVARKHPYETDGPAQHVDDVEITIPETLKLDELPPAARVAIAALTYTSEAKFAGTKLTYHREYTIQAPTVMSDQFADMNRAFAKIATDERAAAVFVAK
jgi:transglutaminase-like putative cysteine protease